MRAKIELNNDELTAAVAMYLDQSCGIYVADDHVMTVAPDWSGAIVRIDPPGKPDNPPANAE